MIKHQSKYHTVLSKVQQVSETKIFNYWIKADSIAQQHNDINTLLIFQEVDDRMTEMYIKETCEAAIIATFHPATAICINIQELEDSGGVWSLHS